MLTVGSLFSGIGGLDLGLERAGMEVIWQSEIDPYGCRVLKKHWPEVVNHGNIKEINWGDVVRPDIICGGYPCQPFSTAGKRNGTDDPRHLWPWVREAISELRPKYAILENVRGHVSLGLNVVLGEMASIGYDAEWQIVSAASVGAPHRRDRVIIVAYPNSRRQQECQSKSEQTPGLSLSSKRVFTRDRWLNALLANATQQYSNGEPDNTRDSARPETLSQSRDSSGTQNVADSDNTRGGTSTSGTDTSGTQEIQRWQNKSQFGTSRRSQDVADTYSAPRQQQQERTVCQPNIGGRGWWETEPDVGRVANGVPSRVDRLRGLGNAVVPQVAELIGRMVLDYDTNL